MSGGAVRHLRAADFRRQPWANGRGETLELARADDGAGMLWRLSLATVAEDGPFSVFPGVDRSLTVIEGPGFDLVGEGIARRAALLEPVAFPGDVPVAARGVTAPSRDFNAMVARGRWRVRVRREVAEFAVPVAPGGSVAILALSLGGVIVNGEAFEVLRGDLLMSRGFAAVFAAAPVLAVALDPVG